MQTITILLQEKKTPIQIALPEDAIIDLDQSESIANYVEQIVPASLIGFDLESIPKVIASKIRERFQLEVQT